MLPFDDVIITENDRCHGAKIVVTCGTTGSSYDNLLCQQWRQSNHHGDDRFLMMLLCGNNESVESKNVILGAVEKIKFVYTCPWEIQMNFQKFQANFRNCLQNGKWIIAYVYNPYYRRIPLTKASGAELYGFLWSGPWINGWVNNREAGDLRRYRAHCDVIVMKYVENTVFKCISIKRILRFSFKFH